MFFIGRPAQYSSSYSTQSTPVSYYQSAPSHYPDMGHDTVLDDDFPSELDVMEHAHQYARAREYAMRDAHEHAIRQAREHVYLAEVVRAQQAREAEERLKIRQAERASLAEVARAQQAREAAQHRLRAQKVEQALFAQARAMEKFLGITNELRPLPARQNPSQSSCVCQSARSYDKYQAPFAHRHATTPSRPSHAEVDDPDHTSMDSILSSFFGSCPELEALRTKMPQVAPASRTPAPKTRVPACPAVKPQAKAKQSAPAAQPTEPSLADFLQALQVAAKGASKSDNGVASLLGLLGEPASCESSGPSLPQVKSKQSTPVQSSTRGPQSAQPHFRDFLQTFQAAAEGVAKPDDGAHPGNLFASLLGLLGEPASSEFSNPSSERIPPSTKGKGKATPLDPIPESFTDADDHTAAQLAADAAFAARLQAEEDRITARNMAQGMRFAQPPATQAAPARPKPEVSKADSTLEQLLQARAAAESDPEVLLAINRLLQSLSPVTSRPTTPTASTLASATAGPSVHASTSAPAPVKVASPSTTLDSIASTLATLTSAFALPALDFSRPASPASSSTQLPFTPANKPLHAYEAALGKLLDRLDAIDAAGDDAIRARRRELVQEVEAALQKLDDAVAEQRAALLSEDLSADEEKGYDVNVDIATATKHTADVKPTTVDTQARNDAESLIEFETPIADAVTATHDEASQLSVETATIPFSPVTIRPLSAHTFPPGSSPLAATDVVTVSDADVDDISSESDLGSHLDETINTFLLPASRAPSPLLNPNHAESDEEVVLVKADEHKGSDGEWSEVDA